jgi:hypothetical protein
LPEVIPNWYVLQYQDSYQYHIPQLHLIYQYNTDAYSHVMSLQSLPSDVCTGVGRFSVWFSHPKPTVSILGENWLKIGFKVLTHVRTD